MTDRSDTSDTLSLKRANSSNDFETFQDRPGQGIFSNLTEVGP